IGDVTGGICKQAVCAASEGAIASIQVESAKPIAENPKAFSDEVVEITSEEQFLREISNANSNVYIDFYATWCGPCKMLKPRFDNWAKTMKGKNKFLKVNVDKVRGLSEKYKIRSMPTMIVLDEKGNVVNRKEGTHEICKHMDAAIPVQ
ncbi:MAG TPA: thioredoxin domain-containing protein, partial [Rhabdochlamydiaceae bacterium]